MPLLRSIRRSTVSPFVQSAVYRVSVEAHDSSLAALAERYNGAYLLDCQLAPAIDLKPYAVDKESAARLWKLTEQLVGQSFDY